MFLFCTHWAILYAAPLVSMHSCDWYVFSLDSLGNFSHLIGLHENASIASSPIAVNWAMHSFFLVVAN